MQFFERKRDFLVLVLIIKERGRIKREKQEMQKMRAIGAMR